MTDAPTWSRITPKAFEHPKARRLVLRVVRELLTSRSPGQVATIRRAGIAQAQTLAADAALDCIVLLSVLSDLVMQGWTIRTSCDELEIAPPSAITRSAEERKAQVRAAHIVDRDVQLLEPAIRRFVREIERPRLVGREWRSIFSLMRDGRELAAKLEQVAGLPEGNRDAALAAIIDPYVQVVEPGAVCEFTDLRLGDIWRYFRHTWNTVYQSTPGRKIRFLVRDRAAPCHPVVGIGALGSAVVQLSVRDRWIGWSPQEFLQRLKGKPSAAAARWLDTSLRRLLSEIKVDDFLHDGLLSRRDIQRPNKEIIEKLSGLGARAREGHRLFPHREQHKKAVADVGATNWGEQAKQQLFRAKRLSSLSELLRARLALLEAGFTRPDRSSLKSVLETKEGVLAIATVLRRVKAAAIGVKMMDVTVCGAVAPYNGLLGGKLVAMLAASPAVTKAYAQRYRRSPGIIASSLAGRAVIRRPELVLLGTTSLFDVATSQYNRLRIPTAAIVDGCEGMFAYVPLGKTQGFGSFHFSQDTLTSMELYLARNQKGRRVNSIFGEGVNPKLRKVREALDELGLPSDVLLRHGSPRLVFGVPLATNFREVLLGFQSRPKWILPMKHGTTKGLVDYWRRRWLIGRVANPVNLDEVGRHAFLQPITHGARVRLPPLVHEQGPLFETEEAVVKIPVYGAIMTPGAAALPPGRASFTVVKWPVFASRPRGEALK